MKKSITIHVNGQVQGVGFRYKTKQTAIQLNINGCAKNMSDGSVRIDAEGEEFDLEQFIEWCKHGPSRAIVNEFRLEKAELSSFEGFFTE